MRHNKSEHRPCDNYTHWLADYRDESSWHRDIKRSHDYSNSSLKYIQITHLQTSK